MQDWSEREIEKYRGEVEKIRWEAEEGDEEVEELVRKLDRAVSKKKRRIRKRGEIGWWNERCNKKRGEVRKIMKDWRRNRASEEEVKKIKKELKK